MDTSPKTIAFENASNNRDHNIYTEEFFGGADQFIYIGGQRYEDISAIQYTVRETLKPIYGYSSRKFDDIAIGTRIVQGVIKVPVRNTNTIQNVGGYTEESSTLTNIGTAKVPNWVYKYTPDVSGSSGVGYDISPDSSTISQVQTSLKRNGYDVDINGINDLKTQKAIENYKRQNSLTVNNSIDAELLNRLNIKDTTAVITSNTSLRYSPDENSSTFYDIDGNTIVIIQYEYGNWYYVQGKDNVKGYIKKSEVVIQ